MDRNHRLYSLQQPIPEWLQQLIHRISDVVMVSIIFAAFIPLNPLMPAMGLDPSWRLAVNQALVQGLGFGKDIIFTYGPYASIYTKTYHPGTDHLMMIGGLVIAIGYSLLLLDLFGKTKIREPWKFTWIVAMAFFINARDVWLFSYPLIGGIWVYLTLQHLQNKKCTGRQMGAVMLLLFPFGLLPLIKGSLFIIILPVLAIAALASVSHKKYGLAMVTVLSPLLCFLSFWCYAGQPVENIGAYLQSTYEIVTGYSEAMSTSNRTDIYTVLAEITAFCTITLLIFLALRKSQYAAGEGIFLYLLFGLYLFTIFKAGFVRLDDEHDLIYSQGLLLAALTLPFLVSSRWNSGVVIAGVLLSLYTSNGYIENDTYSDTVSGIRARFLNAQTPKQAFYQELHSIKEKQPFPLQDGNSDIYSFQQVSLIASGNSWTPRPILQSYSSYTPRLAKQDASFLDTGLSPDNIFFNLESIDKRLPSLDYGPSLLQLLAGYDTQIHPRLEKFILLKKNHTKRKWIHQVVIHQNYGLNAVINLEKNPHLQFIKIHMTPSWLGSIANFILNTPPVFIDLTLDDGSKKTFRVIPEMMRSGFLLSPLLEKNQDVAILMEDLDALEEKSVRTLQLRFPYSGEIFWQSQINILLDDLIKI